MRTPVVDSEFIELKEDGVDFLLWKKKQRSYLYTEEPFLPILSGHKKIRLEDTQTKKPVRFIIPLLETRLLFPITSWIKSQLLSIPPKAFSAPPMMATHSVSSGSLQYVPLYL